MKDEVLNLSGMSWEDVSKMHKSIEVGKMFNESDMMDAEKFMIKKCGLEEKREDFRISMDAMEQMRHQPGIIEGMVHELVKQINVKLHNTQSNSEVEIVLYDDPQQFARIAQVKVRTLTPVLKEEEVNKPKPKKAEVDVVGIGMRKIFLD